MRIPLSYPTFFWCLDHWRQLKLFLMKISSSIGPNPIDPTNYIVSLILTLRVILGEVSNVSGALDNNFPGVQRL